MVLLRCNGWVGTGSGHDQLLRDPPVDFEFVGHVLDGADEDDELLVENLRADQDRVDAALDHKVDADLRAGHQQLSRDTAALGPLTGDLLPAAMQTTVEVAHVWQSTSVSQ